MKSPFEVPPLDFKEIVDELDAIAHPASNLILFLQIHILNQRTVAEDLPVPFLLNTEDLIVPILVEDKMSFSTVHRVHYKGLEEHGTNPEYCFTHAVRRIMAGERIVEVIDDHDDPQMQFDCDDCEKELTNECQKQD